MRTTTLNLARGGGAFQTLYAQKGIGATLPNPDMTIGMVA